MYASHVCDVHSMADICTHTDARATVVEPEMGDELYGIRYTDKHPQPQTHTHTHTKAEYMDMATDTSTLTTRGFIFYAIRYVHVKNALYNRLVYRHNRRTTLAVFRIHLICLSVDQPAYGSSFIPFALVHTFYIPFYRRAIERDKWNGEQFHSFYEDFFLFYNRLGSLLRQFN